MWGWYMQLDAIIVQLEKFQGQLLINRGSGVETNTPEIMGTTIVKIRVLLVQLVDKVAELELSYRMQKASRYDGFLKGDSATKGMSKSAAIDALEFEEDLIKLKVETERVRGYMKYVDGLVSSVQTLIKVQTGIAKNDL